MAIMDENSGPDVVTAEAIGFAADELVACTGCARSNAPNRANCLFCGKVLPVSDANRGSAQFTLRRLESWEPGINLIATKGKVPGNVDAVSRMLAISSEDLVEILKRETPLPLARVEDEETAVTVATTLGEIGVETCSVSDKLLDAQHLPVRVRAVEIGEGELTFTDFNAARTHTLAIDDITLIVTGRIYESRREEVTRRKRGSVKVLDEFETSGDVGVVDIYTSADPLGFRVQTNGFDFSVLGADKGMLAAKNLAKFAEMLAGICTNAVIAGEYDDIRHYLDLVWEPENKKDIHGMQISGYGRRQNGATFTSSNQMQFTKYSRMRRMMI